MDKAKQLGKNMGRATGSAVLGGGLLRNVPGFQEVGMYGDMLGECIAGDPENCEKHIRRYADESLVINAAISCVINGDMESAKVYGVKTGKASLSAGATIAGVAITVGTGGLAAPMGIGAAAAIGGVVGGGAAVGGIYTEAAIQGTEVDPGEVIGSALMGGVVGAAAGGLQAAKHAKLQQTKVQGKNLTQTGRNLESNANAPSKAVYAEIHADTGDVRSGFNKSARSIHAESTNAQPYPRSNNPHPHVDKIANNPAVQGELQKIVDTSVKSRPLANCAEAHALENLKKSNSVAIPKENYVVQKVNGPNGPTSVVKAPCENCQAVSKINGYGEAPFGKSKYDSMPISKAVETRTANATQVLNRVKLGGAIAKECFKT